MSEYNAYKYYENASLLRGARWASDDEIRQITRRVRLSDPDAEIHSGLPVISNGDTVYLDDSDAHSLIIGSTGSKKSRLFAMPMLEIMRRAGESVVVTDPKGELFDLTSTAFRESGYMVNVINLRDPVHSNGWNPLALARKCMHSQDMERAAAIVNDFAAAMIQEPKAHTDPFWTQTSRAMLQGLIMMMIENEKLFPDQTVNLLTFRQLSDHTDRDEHHSVLDLVDIYPADSLTQSNLHMMRTGSERTYDNIRVSYEAPMQQMYIQKSLVTMLSTDEINFSRLGLQKAILYLIMPDEKTTLNAIISLIIKICYEQLISTAQDCDGLTLPQRVNFLLDEFSNIPAIPDMPAMISAARSRNIKFFLIIQGLYQLSSKYGQDNANTIKGNCANWAFLTSRELPLLEEISNLCGQDAATGEKLITVSQLQRFNKERGEVLILLGRQYPYIAHLADISEYHLPPAGQVIYPKIQPGAIQYRSYESILEEVLFKPEPAETFAMPSLDELFLDGQTSLDESLDSDLIYQTESEKYALLEVLGILMEAVATMDTEDGCVHEQDVSNHLNVGPVLADYLIKACIDAGIVEKDGQSMQCEVICNQLVKQYTGPQCVDKQHFDFTMTILDILAKDLYRIFLHASREAIAQGKTSMRWLQKKERLDKKRADYIKEAMESFGIINTDYDAETGAELLSTVLLTSNEFEKNVTEGKYQQYKLWEVS